MFYVPGRGLHVIFKGGVRRLDEGATLYREVVEAFKAWGLEGRS